MEIFNFLKAKPEEDSTPQLSKEAEQTTITKLEKMEQKLKKLDDQISEALQANPDSKIA